MRFVFFPGLSALLFGCSPWWPSPDKGATGLLPDSAVDDSGDSGTGDSGDSGSAEQDCSTASGYELRVVELPDEATTQWRLCRDSQHFGTLMLVSEALVFRGHPGVDPNGFGSSAMLGAFLPGAVLAHASMDSIQTDSSGIHLEASGGVSEGADSTYGSWSLALSLGYDPFAKRTEGVGLYTIELPGLLADKGDLNLYRISSNLMEGVPIIGGGTGTTGDVGDIRYTIDGVEYEWDPQVLHSHYPTDEGDSLEVVAEGRYNEVDTAAQGYEPIEPAWKPSMEIGLTNLGEPGVGMRFGGQWDAELSDLFYADNLGINPWIARSSERTTFDFAIVIGSEALAGDGS
jgi:hypothetical protein